MSGETANELRKLRDDFKTNAEKTIAEFNGLIAKADAADRQQQNDAILEKFVPGKNLESLKGHDVVFLVNKSKEMTDGEKNLLRAALETMSQMKALTKSAQDFTVSGKIWGGDRVEAVTNIDFACRTQTNVNKAAVLKDKNFLPVAKDILMANMPDQVSGRQTHYIIVCSGTIADDTVQAASILASAAGFNAGTTFDFIVCGDNAGNIEQLTWAGAQAPTVTKTGAKGDLGAAMMDCFKERIAATQPKAPATKIGFIPAV